MAASYSISVDGAKRTLQVDDPNMPLLYALRDELGLNNPRFGCGQGQCGACTVHIDGQPARSCVTPLSAVATSSITTLAGIGDETRPHPLQSAWIAEEASQCGYCLNGFMMVGVALLKANPNPSETEIKAAFENIKCRCGTHLAVVRAVKSAARVMAGGVK